MKRILLGAATTALLFAGCAQNELLDGGIVTPNDGKIYFSATSGVPTNTRAAAGNPINSTADLQKIGTFKVAGFHNGTDEYVGTAANPVTVTWTNGTSWEYSNEPYWPSTGTMNFLAYANWGTGTANIPLPTITGTGMTATVKIDEDATTAHTDLLVAATYDATKEVRTLLTFKHALTQIVFKAANLSVAGATDALDVHIGGIKIVNVSETGTMTVSKAADGKAQIGWAGQAPQTAQRVDYKVESIDTDATADGSFVVPRVAPGDQTKYSLYPRVQNAAEPANNALMLIPQNFTAWDANKGVSATDATQHGAYIAIDAIIRKAGSDKQAEWFCGTKGNMPDLSDATYGTIYIPVSSLGNEVARWEAGKRINYIITFGDKNSGSGGGGYDENGDPILVPIKFRAVVEDWVETNVPLLTATFEATSSAITNKFITGYVNQMLADVKDAAAPKVIKANIDINGTVSNEMNTASDDAALSTSHNFLTATLANGQIYSSKFRPGSTVTYDLEGVTNWNGKTTELTVPAGWEARTYQNGGVANPAPATNPAIAATGKVTLGVTAPAANKLVLTKVPTTYAVYNSHVDYIEDNIGGVVLNEKSLAATFATTIYVAGPVVRANTAFSSDMLSELVATPNGATLTINMAAVTGWTGNSITTWCPAGWMATVQQAVDVLPGDGIRTYFPGDPIAISNTTSVKTIVFTKASIATTHNYVGLSSLKAWLENTSVKANGEIFYYDNVDFDVAITLTGAPWKDITGVSDNNTAVVKLKYPLSAGKVTGTQVDNTTTGWTYDGAGTLTYTKKP